MVVSVWRKTNRKEATWLMFMSSPSRASLKFISLIGCFFDSEKVECRNRMDTLKLSVSMSSEPAVYTKVYLPPPAPSQHIVLLLLRALRGHAKYERQKRGKARTMTMGIPISFTIHRHSTKPAFKNASVAALVIAAPDHSHPLSPSMAIAPARRAGPTSSGAV
jgi:hypothetical protein